MLQVSSPFFYFCCFQTLKLIIINCGTVGGPLLVGAPRHETQQPPHRYATGPHTLPGKFICAPARHCPMSIQSRVSNLKSLAQVVFEILHSKRIGVTSLTFQGHVTTSVTWPFDSPYAFPWPFGTKPLCLTVSELFNAKCNVMVDVTLIRPLNNGQGHSFWYQSISYIRLPIGIGSQ